MQLSLASLVALAVVLTVNPVDAHGWLNAIASNSPQGANDTGSPSLLKTVFPQCGPNGATPQITSLAGPNGAESFLNCGIESEGWTPPPVKLDDLVMVNLSEALQDPDSPFKNCEPYLPLFNQYGDQTGIPPTFLASIAMQLSSCDADAVGGAGEQGLMQIPMDQCAEAPGGDCKTPSFNIITGGESWNIVLQSNDGNVLQSLGEYNGWKPGMTLESATSVAAKCCNCQNDLDFLHRFVNGWLLNRDPSAAPTLGHYHNLDQCQS